MAERDTRIIRARYLSPPELYRDAPYAYAAVAPAGSLVFTAGACPLDGAGTIVAAGDHEAQARQAVENLLATLAAAGASGEQILKTTIYVVARERADLVRVWNVVRAALRPARPPSTLLGVSVLGYPDQLVELEAVALTSD